MWRSRENRERTALSEFETHASGQLMKKDNDDPRRLERDVVNIDNPLEVDRWAEALNVTAADLVRAVELVGPSAGSVYDYISRSRLDGGAPG
jgi:hypothetical protein